MQFFVLLLKILPYLPTLIQVIEQIFGAGNGQKKLAAAVQLISAVVPAVGESVANAPENQAKLETVIGATVAAINAAGNMGTMPTTMFTPTDSGA